MILICKEKLVLFFNKNLFLNFNYWKAKLKLKKNQELYKI